MIDLINEKTPPLEPTREAALREAIEQFFFAYRAFTRGPDEILAKRGLSRVHHRILYFVGQDPGLSVTALLDVLAVSKQALNAPLRQLTEAGLISSEPNPQDKRAKQLSLTVTGKQLEAQLTGTQIEHLQNTFAIAGSEAEAGWRQAMRCLMLNKASEYLEPNSVDQNNPAAIAQ